MLALPTLLWTAETEAEVDSMLEVLAGIGMASGAVAVCASGLVLPRLALLSCYVCYISIAAVGIPFYSYGWESQLLETTFLAVVFGPLALRWLCFKTMLGAGLIKERAKRRPSDSWRDLTVMTTFFETQPCPGPLSRRLHFLPRQVLLFATASNHVIELFAPWLLVLAHLPTPLSRSLLVAYGSTHLLFQFALCLSGNLSFLNYLTALPALACFDDGFFPFFDSNAIATAPGTWSFVSELVGLAPLAWLNAPVWHNLFAPSSTSKARPPRQAMNAQFDRVFRGVNLRPFRLANSYGAFGSVATVRDEIVVQGARSPQDDWREYVFRASPSIHDTRAPQIAPWHCRLDWQKWIAACRGAEAANDRWFLAFLVALLQNDPHVTRLLKTNPFHDTPPPSHLRVLIYTYRFAPLASPEIWTRDFKTTLLRPVGLHELRAHLLRLDDTS